QSHVAEVLRLHKEIRTNMAAPYRMMRLDAGRDTVSPPFFFQALLGPRASGYRQTLTVVKDCAVTHRGEIVGGAGRDRTADKGFADLRLTTWLPRLRPLSCALPPEWREPR